MFSRLFQPSYTAGRGPSRMIEAHTRHTIASIRPHPSGIRPSTVHSHARDAAM